MKMMLEKEKKAFQGRINKAVNSLMTDAYIAASDITEEVYVELLSIMRDRIDERLQMIEERKNKNGNRG